MLLISSDLLLGHDANRSEPLEHLEGVLLRHRVVNHGVDEVRKRHMHTIKLLQISLPFQEVLRGQHFLRCIEIVNDEVQEVVPASLVEAEGVI